jgi:hypothetical protein
MVLASKQIPKAATASAKVSTPVKQSSARKQTPGGTPPSGRKSRADILKSASVHGPKKAGWYLTSVLLQGFLELIFITKESMNADAFLHPLITALNKKYEGEMPAVVTETGLVGSYRMRILLEDPDPLLSAGSEYPRRAFLRVHDGTEESATKSRLASLNVIKLFLTDRDNFKWCKPVFIEEPGWDLTPVNSPRPKLDHYLQYQEIVKIITLTHGSDGKLGKDWGLNNPDAVHSYFSEGHIPFQAHADLGIPLDNVMQVPNKDDDDYHF